MLNYVLKQKLVPLPVYMCMNAHSHTHSTLDGSIPWTKPPDPTGK